MEEPNEDKICTCKAILSDGSICGKDFTFTVAEQELATAKGWFNLDGTLQEPSVCEDCRKKGYHAPPPSRTSSGPVR